MKKKDKRPEGSGGRRHPEEILARNGSGSKKSGNREFAGITYFFVTLFLVLIGYIVYFNAVRAGSIINSPYNKRKDAFADRIIRGNITDRNGNVLAETVIEDDGTEKRYYPYGDSLAHVVGFCDPVAGKSGLESTQNFALLTSDSFFTERLLNDLKGRKNIGDTIVTTLDADLQEASVSALGLNKGAVVIMEADTGRILSLVSSPSFDPNFAGEDWEDLNTEGNSSPLLNRATLGLYAPGSTFKIVTALEYIRENRDYRNYGYECDGNITYEGVTISCPGHTAHGYQDLRSSMANSCNCSFANIGLSLDKVLYKKTAEELLFNKDLPPLLNHTKSSFKIDENSGPAEVMMTAMGQGKTMMSPYHMALITAAVANNGLLMKPYLVQKVTNHKGSQIRKYMPQTFKRVMTAEEAAALKELLNAVVEEGTASALNGRPYLIAGKTGTAEYGNKKDGKVHSWFTGFTGGDTPDLVITVVIEDYDVSSGFNAAQTAGRILDFYYD